MGQVIKRALSQTHVTWFSNRVGLGKGCDLSNLPNLQNIVCLQKVANPQMQSCLSLSDLLPPLPSHRTFISISTFLCPLVCSYPFQVPRNSGQNGESLFRLSLYLLSVEFYFWGNLLRGMVVRKFPILVLSVFSWETWQKRLIGFPSMAVNNQSQMREAAGQHCFLKGGGWGVGEVGAKTGLHRLTSCSIHAQHPQDWLYEQWGGSGLSICCSTEAIWILGRWAVA